MWGVFGPLLICTWHVRVDLWHGVGSMKEARIWWLPLHFPDYNFPSSAPHHTPFRLQWKWSIVRLSTLSIIASRIWWCFLPWHKLDYQVSNKKMNQGLSNIPTLYPTFQHWCSHAGWCRLMHSMHWCRLGMYCILHCCADIYASSREGNICSFNLGLHRGWRIG